MPSDMAVDVIKNIKGYLPYFQAAFPDEQDSVTFENIVKAIAAFERTLTQARQDPNVHWESGWLGNNSWIRGTCQYGIMPANGFLYAPPDACACFHPHTPGQSDHFTSEIAPPDVPLMQDFNSKALHWPRFTDSTDSFAVMDALLEGGVLVVLVLFPAITLLAI